MSGGLADNGNNKLMRYSMPMLSQIASQINIGAETSLRLWERLVAPLAQASLPYLLQKGIDVLVLVEISTSMH